MHDIHISLMENQDIQESAQVLSLAMLNNPIHLAVFRGNSEAERLKIEKMFLELFIQLPGIIFLAKERQRIIGVMRMKSCVGRKITEVENEVKDENDVSWRKYLWRKEWAEHDPTDQHWHLGPIGVLPSHRKKGIGSMLMQRFCREADACSAKAYLETDLDENVRFYNKFRFKSISTSILVGVESRYMERVSTA